LTAIHGVRSDADSWQSAWMNLGAISGLASSFSLVRNSDSNLREGTEHINGFDAIRYSVDTTRATGVETGLYRATLGPGGFEKGTVWVTSQGCPVKLSLMWRCITTTAVFNKTTTKRRCSENELAQQRNKQ